MGKLLVYKASAGSGKTFTLAIEYIKLLIEDPTVYKNILAVTFTNKATAEMKERILNQLYGISTANTESEPYFNKIIEDTQYSEKRIRENAAKALHNIIHDYGKFRIETIDSFFQSVMRNLARELELSPNMNIELKKEDIVANSIDNMLHKLDAKSPLLTVVMNYIKDKIDDGKKWNITEEMNKFSMNIFNEDYAEIGKKLRDKVYDTDVIVKYKKHLTDVRKQVLQEMSDACDEFYSLLQRNSLQDSDLKGGSSRGISSYYRKLKRGELDNDVVNKTVMSCLEAPEEWVAKTNKRAVEIISIVSLHLMPHLIETEEKRQKMSYIYNTCELSLKNINNLQLIAHIDKEIRLFNKEKNQILLSDTNMLLHSIIQDEDSSFVYEKIGTNIKHIMIDEFQDTSMMQWRNFKILLFEALSHQNNNSLIVGDVKQSIYRWRNSDWKILNNLEDNVNHVEVDVRTLDTNRRSESNVIQFNNKVFTHCIKNVDSQHSELINAYRDVVQKTPKTNNNGYVRVQFFDKNAKETDSYQTLTFASMKEQLERIFSSGVRQQDVAILIRYNRVIPEVASFLEKECGYKVVSNEAFRLDSSLSVNLLMDCLRYISDNKDEISLSQIAISYQKGVLGNSVGDDVNSILYNRQSTLFVPEEFFQQMDNLKQMPLYDLIEELYQMFQLQKVSGQDPYVFSFFDSVIEYLRNNDIDLRAFIKYWEDNLCGKTIPNEQIDGIRIVSIHKSKGLEFHTVLIPFCDWHFESSRNKPILWCKVKDDDFKEVEYMPISYDKKMENSAYSEEYLNEKMQIYVDNLNLLYVAFTRAGKNLFVWSAIEKVENSISAVLHSSMLGVCTEECVNLDEGVYEVGALMGIEQKEQKESSNKLEQKAEMRTVEMYCSSRKSKFKQSNNSAKFIKGDEESSFDFQYINRGKMLHSLFSTIKTKDDIPKSVDNFVKMGIIKNGEERDEVQTLAFNAIDNPKVADWYTSDWKLFNECEILTFEGNTFIRKRPDRVMTKNNRAIVVDFKFAKPSSKYKKQIEDYKQLLTDMGYEDVKGYLWYVDKDEVVRV